MLDLKRTRWEGGVGGADWLGKSLKAGKHTIEFDFKYDGPGIAKGGTGVLKVDGKDLSTQKLEHTIPFLLPPDETFDVGVDTRTGVDGSYQIPFRFDGRINKLTFRLGATQLTAEEETQGAAGGGEGTRLERRCSRSCSRLPRSSRSARRSRCSSCHASSSRCWWRATSRAGGAARPRGGHRVARTGIGVLAGQARTCSGIRRRFAHAGLQRHDRPLSRLSLYAVGQVGGVLLWPAVALHAVVAVLLIVARLPRGSVRV